MLLISPAIYMEADERYNRALTAVRSGLSAANRLSFFLNLDRIPAARAT